MSSAKTTAATAAPGIALVNTPTAAPTKATPRAAAAPRPMTRAKPAPRRTTPEQRGLPGKRWAIAGALVGSLLALTLFAPAQWLARTVNDASSERLQLLDARGTLWRGSAQLWLTGGPGSQDRAALPQRLSWTLNPSWVGLTATLQADCCTAQPLTLRLAPHQRGLRLQLDDALSVWPAALLTGLGTPWNTLRPEGRLQLSSQGLQVQWTGGQLHISGSAAVEAQSLSSALSTLRPMGSYRLALQGTAPNNTNGSSSAATNIPAELTLLTLGGSLQLTGTGQYRSRGGLRFNGEASATPGSEDALGNFLNIIGKRQGARSLITLG